MVVASVGCDSRFGLDNGSTEEIIARALMSSQSSNSMESSIYIVRREGAVASVTDWRGQA
jgi:hypothetical protein